MLREAVAMLFKLLIFCPVIYWFTTGVINYWFTRKTKCVGDICNALAKLLEDYRKEDRD